MHKGAPAYVLNSLVIRSKTASGRLIARSLVKRCSTARWVYVLSQRLSELRLFRIPACGPGKRLGQTSSVSDGKQHRLRVQTRPGGGSFAIHKEMTIGADGCLCIRGVCLPTWQAERENRALWVQVANALRSRCQSNLTAVCCTGGKDMSYITCRLGSLQC